MVHAGRTISALRANVACCAYIILLYLATLGLAGLGDSAFADQFPPLRIREVDGSPSLRGIREIRVSNGTLTSVSAGVVSLATGGGTVTGTGTNGTLPKFTNGPGGVLGNSVIIEGSSPASITIAGNLTVNNSNLVGSVVVTTDIIGNALTGRSSWDASVSAGEKTSGTGLVGQVLIVGVPATFHLDVATGFDTQYIGAINTAGSLVDSVIGWRLKNWSKGSETISECVAIFSDASYDNFAPGNTYFIKSASTAPALLSGPFILATTNGASEKFDSTSDLITLSTSGATTDSSANLLPANSVIMSVDARVTTTITTASDWKVGDSGATARFISAQTGLTAGTTAVGLDHTDGGVAAGAGMKQGSAAKIRITTTGTPGAGAIRITVHYYVPTAPTS